jgi:energy-coupling factor transport system ATP-binding protein
MAHLEIANLNFRYPEATALALADLSFTMERGEFVVLCGASGSGKTTLLRHLKTALTPFGERSGHVRFSNRALDDVSLREQASAIGFVLQNPDNQIVTDKVWHELAFGLESLGLAPEVIRLRTAEMASFFGMQTWYHKKVIELSGGQKQLLNLAAVMALQPELLILDEPTSQLDPIAAAEFLAAVKKVNGELGVTVLLSEHRLEDALPLADRVAVMAAGRLMAFGSAEEVGRHLSASDDPMLFAMPTPMRAALALDAKREGGAKSPGGAGGGGGGIVSTAAIASTAATPATTAAASATASTTAAAAATAASTSIVPVSVREGRQWLEQTLASCAETASPSSAPEAKNLDLSDDKGTDRHETALIFARDLWFRYERTGADILRGLSLSVQKGEFLAIVGGNGTGKSTALGVLSGELRAYRGKLEVAGLHPATSRASERAACGLTVLPQDPQTLFVHNSVLEDLAAAIPSGLNPDKRDERLREVIEATEIAGILSQHPYDISGGEQQRAALAIALLTEPRILLLDEPTKGMDAFFKRRFAQILARLRKEGLTLVMVSHDVEFCAAWAERCALFFDGAIVTEGSPRAFFSGNSFYTTAANRMSRGLLESVVTAEDLIGALSRLPRTDPLEASPPTNAATNAATERDAQAAANAATGHDAQAATKPATKPAP